MDSFALSAAIMSARLNNFINPRLFTSPMQYPKEVVAVSSQGKEEARALIDKGTFIRYSYIDIKTGKTAAKYTILLDNGKEIEHYFIVPYQDKELVVKKVKESKGKKRKIWDENGKKIVEF